MHPRTLSHQLTSTSALQARPPLLAPTRGLRAPPTRATSQSAAKHVMSSGFVDYYELLQVDDDAPPTDIKAAYRSLAKACHPDILGDAEGHNICILLNEAYEVLTDPDKRAAYDVQLEQAIRDDEDDYSGEALSRWVANSRMGKNENPDETRAVFVDEATCIGCKQCVWCAPATFRIEPAHGRSRVFAQWLDTEDDLQAAIDACPVSCIHWVERDQLPGLEYVMQNVVPRENVGVMMAGQGRPVEDVFAATDRFLKQRARKEQLDEARRRYSKQQEAARKAAAAAVAAKQANWLQGALGSLFGVADVMRGNMGYGDARVGRRKRTGPVRYDPNRGTIPKERALVPVSVTARQHDYLEY